MLLPQSKRRSFTPIQNDRQNYSSIYLNYRNYYRNILIVSVLPQTTKLYSQLHCKHHVVMKCMKYCMFK
jgi:hypothetical protein